MKQSTAAAFAFMAASIFPAAYLAIVFPVSGTADLQSILGSFILYYGFAGLATAILGVPVYFILNKYKLVTWWSALGFGALAGTLTALALLGKYDSENQLRFALLGGVAGLLFWSIWKTGRT